MRFISLNLAALSLVLLGAVAIAGAETPAGTETPGKSGGAAAGDAEAGKKVFIKCQACHAVEEGVSKIGPSLHGVIGRKAGTLTSYPGYSDQMKASGVVWNENTIAEFVKNPRTFIKSTRMIFVGLKNDREIANLIAYLKTAQ